MDETEFPRAIGRPAARALLAAGLCSWADLAAVSRADAEALHGVGPKALTALDEGLRSHWLTWRA